MQLLHRQQVASVQINPHHPRYLLMLLSSSSNGSTPKREEENEENYVKLCIIINNYARFVYGRRAEFTSLLPSETLIAFSISLARSAQTIIDWLTLIVRSPLSKQRPSGHAGRTDVRGRSNDRNPSSIGGRHPTQARWGHFAVLDFSFFPQRQAPNYASSTPPPGMRRNRRRRQFLAISLSSSKP